MATQKTLQYYEMKHPLKDAKILSPTALSQIPNSDVDDYEVEHEKYIVPAFDHDTTILSERKSEVLDSLRTLYGSQSKEYKYMERSFRKGDDKITNHYNKNVPPSLLRRKISEARQLAEGNGGYKKASSGVDSDSMEDIDSAIKFLISEGYEYGKDFSSHNSVSIANALIPEIAEEYILGKKEIDGMKIPSVDNDGEWTYDSDIYSCSDILLSNDYNHEQVRLSFFIEEGEIKVIQNGVGEDN